MILHLAFNTFLVFLVLAGAIELFFLLFRVKNARVRTLCRLFPVAKLPFDLLIFSVYGKSFLINLNPFSCEMFLRETLSLPAYIASQWPPLFVKGLIFGIATLSAFKALQRWEELIRSHQWVKEIRRTSLPCRRPIQNALLRKQLAQKKVVVLTSPTAQAPFAAGLRLIVIPEVLMGQLTQTEFESVVSHEFEHLNWKDPAIKVLSHFLCALFWWIPTKWWIKRLETDQEQASDTGIYKYNIDSLSLAQAFVKAAAHAKSGQNRVAICPFASKRDRLKQILNLQKMDDGKCKRTLLGTLCLLVFCCVWSC